MHKGKSHKKGIYIGESSSKVDIGKKGKKTVTMFEGRKKGKTFKVGKGTKTIKENNQEFLPGGDYKRTLTGLKLTSKKTGSLLNRQVRRKRKY